MGDTYTCQPLPSVKHLHPYGTCVQTSYTAACCKYYERSWWMGTKNPRADVMARSWWSLCLGGDRKSILIWFWQNRTPCGGTMLECSGALVSFETVGGWQVFSSVQTLFRLWRESREIHGGWTAETFGQAVLLNRATGRWRHETSLKHLERAGKN